jgi:hypothetical protein
MATETVDFPLDHVFTYIKSCSDLTNYIVAPQCNGGWMEVYFANKLNTQFILTDPVIEMLPKKHSDNIFTYHGHVKDLVIARPEVIGNCTLFNYRHTRAENIAHVESDYEMITLLKPKYLIVIYYVDRDNGTAFISKYEKNYKEYTKLLETPEKCGWNEVASTKYCNEEGMFAYPDFGTIKWLAREDCGFPDNSECLKLQEIQNAGCTIPFPTVKKKKGCIIL